MAETFHRRGHHSQKAHGRRYTLAADDDPTQGGMIALMPSAADAKRLALPGGEPAAELHCTLFYLGDDGSVWNDDQRDELESLVRALASLYELEPVQARVFGVAHWNGDGEKPSWVWSVGDADPQDGNGLVIARAAVAEALESTHDRPELPVQHAPWVAHICAAYDGDLTLTRALEKRLGPVTFDRIRLSFGDDDRDIPLQGALTASAFRRELMDHEEFCDFAEHNRQWEGAVATTAGRLYTELADWRAQIREQIIAGADTPEEFAGITVETTDAAGLLDEAMRSLAERAGLALQREAEKQGVEIPEWSLPDDTVTAAVGGRRLLRSVSQMTADLLASNMVQTAKRLTLGLLTRDQSPEALASEVDRALQEGQEAAVKGPVGVAMATAQTAGRQAVLEAAPPGEYYASELLDRNTCGPCKAVDGEQFGSLEIAIKAYPVMGYKDCVGPRYGNSCRGLIVARWTLEPEETEPVTAAGDGHPFHGTPGRPSYRKYHPSGRNKQPQGKTRHSGGGWLGSDRFTEAQHEDAAFDYQGRAYRDVNAHLRSGTEPKRNTMEEVRSVTSALTDLINIQEPTTSDQTLYRGTRQLRLGLRPGDEFHDRGFTSMSGDEDIASSMTGVGGSLFKIRARKGIRLLDLPSIGGEASEKERISAPGTKMRVISAHEPDDPLETAVYEVEIING